MRSMSEVMNYYGTDKDMHHRYAAVYDRLFPDRMGVESVLEVGIAEGQSMLAWREIFPRAHIVGMDQHPCPCQRGPRLEFHQGNQRDKAALLRAVGGRHFDLIVEDAAHELDANLLTLFWLWPFVKEGGVYVIEEMQDAALYRENVEGLFRGCEWVPTVGPYGDGVEALIVLRKA